MYLNSVGALKDSLGLQLVGPFDILAGAHKTSSNAQPNYHLHWRYFYDPPEFQTILTGCEDSQHHIGYYRYMKRMIIYFLLSRRFYQRFTLLLYQLMWKKTAGVVWNDVTIAVSGFVSVFYWISLFHQRCSRLPPFICWRKWSQEGLHYNTARGQRVCCRPVSVNQQKFLPASFYVIQLPGSERSFFNFLCHMFVVLIVFPTINYYISKSTVFPFFKYLIHFHKTRLWCLDNRNGAPLKFPVTN